MSDIHLNVGSAEQGKFVNHSLLSWVPLERCPLTLRVMTFCMMLAVAVVPIAVFYKWVERTSFENELKQVDENHLIIAKNLSSTLSRYATDALSVVNFVMDDINNPRERDQFALLLKNFDICYVSLIDAQNAKIGHVEGVNAHNQSLPDAETMAHLRKLAAEKPGETVVSGLLRHFDGSRFFIVRQTEDGQLALASWAPRYIRELQKSIAFGELGHSMMVDQNGTVIAHPNAEWQKVRKNASKLSVVQAMMAGQTGVMQFYSPPMAADMIAGYTFVPETGWGVMVPQPIRELQVRAEAVQNTALYISITIVLLASIVGLWFSRLLSTPIQSLVATTQRVSEGDYSARVPIMPLYAPCEIKRLANSFNLMVDDITHKNDQLTEKLQSEEELSAQRAALLKEAQRANKVKSQFVSTISHELRTPLTSIKGSLELMSQGAVGDMPPKAQRMTDIAIKNAGRLQALIDDILDLEKLDGGHMEFRRNRVDLGRLLAESLEANESYAKLHGVQFALKVPSDPVHVTGDTMRLMQVMANFLSNAAKFSDGHDTVDVILEQTCDSNVRVSVRDYGIGISHENQTKLFQKFVQVDADDTRRFGGTGLGLAITRMIVNAHKGTVGFKSAPGEGSTFWFDLPVADESA